MIETVLASPSLTQAGAGLEVLETPSSEVPARPSGPQHGEMGKQAAERDRAGVGPVHKRTAIAYTPLQSKTNTAKVKVHARVLGA